MPNFSSASSTKLYSCCSEIIFICQEAIKIYDFTVISGFRNKEEQDAEFAAGNSEKKWPLSKHNTLPKSDAVDLAPYPIDWSDNPLNRARYYFLAGILYKVAQDLSIPIRQGIDWNGNFIYTDQKFHDIGHMEIIR